MADADAQIESSQTDIDKNSNTVSSSGEGQDSEVSNSAAGSKDRPASDVRLVNGVYCCERNGQTLQFDNAKNEWVAVASSETQADNLQQMTDEERQKYMQNINGLWVYRDPSTFLASYYDCVQSEWVTPGHLAHTKHDEQKSQTEPKAADENANAPKTVADDDFEYQLKLQKVEQQRAAEKCTANKFVDPRDSTEYEWDMAQGQWLPVVDEDFIARYQASYGVQHDEATINASISSLPRQVDFDAAGASGSDDDQNENTEKAGTSAKSAEKLKEEEEERRKVSLMNAQERKVYAKQKKKEKKALQAERDKKREWFQMEDTQNRNVYVCNLPSTITDQEYEELMAKCGVIDMDPNQKALKVKLYKNEDGTNKGDGRCCYVKRESVDLALQILDGMLVQGNQIKVQIAKFELKGDYDPTKKKKKLNPKQLQKFKERQTRMFDWHPEKQRGERSKHDRTVVLSNLFTLTEINKSLRLAFDIEELLYAECAKYGTVNKVQIFDTNEDGVATVQFDTAVEADACISMLNARMLRGRQLKAFTWDGKTKYKMAAGSTTNGKEDKPETDKAATSQTGGSTDTAQKADSWEAFLEGSSSDESELED